MAARGEDDVAGLARLAALVGVDLPLAGHDDEELVAVGVRVALVAGAGAEDGAADDELVGAGGAGVDQELDVHVDPAVVDAEPLLERHVRDPRPVGDGLVCHRLPPMRRKTS